MTTKFTIITWIYFALISILGVGLAKCAHATRINIYTDLQGSDPACGANMGALAYRSDTNKWRKCENNVWSDFGSGGSGAATTDHFLTSTNEADLSADIFPSATDQVPLTTSSSTTVVWTSIPDSDGTTQKLQYDVTTHAFSAGTDDDVPESGDFTNLTGGAGITNSAGTLSTDSTEQSFLASGALTCGAATNGKMQVHTTPLQYCDNAATPTLQYAAYGDSSGNAKTGDSATAFFSSGALEVSIGGNGAAPGGDDQVVTSSSASAAAWKTIPDTSGALQALNYTQSSNTWGTTTIHPTVTLGPFEVNDLPGTATTQLGLQYMNTTSAASLTNGDITVRQAAHVIGMFITSDAARTAGTATAQVRINGSATAFNAGSVVLNATDTLSDSDIIAHASGNAVTAGQKVGCAIVTSSWTPTTADIDCWVVLSMD